MNIKEYKTALNMIKNKVIAIVYTFQNENWEEKYYDPWKGDVIADWTRAIYEIECVPNVIDFESFAQKAFNNFLPKIDFVINLNNGSKDLSSLGLVPSICSYLNIPCLPSKAETLLMGENKFVSNCLAEAFGLKIPKYLSDNDPNGIIRPNSSGSSKGIHLGNVKDSQNDLHQEFIKGFDMTISFMYNPLKSGLSIVSPIMYVPNNNNINWHLGDKQKESRNEYSKQSAKINNNFAALLEKYAQTYFSINSLCRIDTRVKCDRNEDIFYYSNHIIEQDRIYFLEINPLPTIKEGINFANALESVDENSDFKKCRSYFNEVFEDNSITSFILSTLMLSLSV